MSSRRVSWTEEQLRRLTELYLISVWLKFQDESHEERRDMQVLEHTKIRVNMANERLPLLAKLFCRLEIVECFQNISNNCCFFWVLTGFVSPLEIF